MPSSQVLNPKPFALTQAAKDGNPPNPKAVAAEGLELRWWEVRRRPAGHVSAAEHLKLHLGVGNYRNHGLNSSLSPEYSAIMTIHHSGLGGCLFVRGRGYGSLGCEAARFDTGLGLESYCCDSVHSCFLNWAMGM